MEIDGPLIPAVFIQRPNRFITVVEISGKQYRSHLPDPGRLTELLIPGVSLLVCPAINRAKRKTAYTTVMVKIDDKWISLVSTLPNKFVKHSFNNNTLPMFKAFDLVRPEIKVGNHRFDFLLQDSLKNDFYLEVKSITLVEKGVARFPDAITERGKKHAEKLMELVSKGEQAGILFVCQRPDAYLFKPMWDRDPNFSQSLLNAYKSGVKVWCITLHIYETEVTFNKQIPVNLERNQ